MIDTITLLIDNEQKLLEEFIGMTKEAFDEQELAETISNWFEHWLDDEFVEIHAITGDRKYNRSLSHVYASILRQSIQDIHFSDWCVIASHYITKANESN